MDAIVPPPLVITLELTRTETPQEPFRFATGRQRYLLRAGKADNAEIEINWDDRLLQLLARLSRPRPPPAVLSDLGEVLRTALANTSWAGSQREIEAAVAAGRPITVDIVSGAAELYQLPWELAPVGDRGLRLAEIPTLLLRYAWPGLPTRARAAAPEGGRILFAWAAPRGGVPFSEMAADLRAAVAQTAGLAPVDCVELPRASPDALVAAVRGAKPTVLCLLSHGSAGEEGGLLLHGDGPEGVVVDPEWLRRLLDPVVASLSLVVLAACNSGASPKLLGSLTSLAQTMHRLGVPAVVAFRLPVTLDGAVAATRTLFARLGDLGSLEDGFRAARAALLPANSVDWVSLQLYARAEDGENTRPFTFRPYRGLLAYRPEHTRLYFGRDQELTELRDELLALQKAGLPRLQVVEGASGSGKSSLVLAGLIPSLRGAGWEWAYMVPGADPGAALDAALSSLQPSTAAFRILVVDQLEELFTQRTDDPAPADAFTRRLWALASEQAGSVTHVVATVRSDFKGRLGELHLDDNLRMDQLFRPDQALHHVFVALLSPAQLREVIAQPAQALGLEIAPSLMESMVNDVAAEPGALPLLAYTLDLLWQRREGVRLTEEVYRALGGVSGALSGHAEDLIASLDAEHTRVARRLLVRLVSLRDDSALDTRKRVLIAALRPRRPEAAQVFDQVLSLLVDERLLVRGGGGAPTVEVAHEAIIRKWTTLRRWVAEDRPRLVALERLEQAAQAWKDEAGPLLSGKRLLDALELENRFPDDLSEGATALIGASRDEERRQTEEERRRRQDREDLLERERKLADEGRIRNRNLALFAGVVALLLAGFGWTAFRASGRAELAAARTRDQLRMRAVQDAPYDPLLKALMLREMEQREGVSGWMAEAAALAWVPLPERMLGWDRVQLARMSSDGRWAVTQTQTQTRLWDLNKEGDGLVLSDAPNALSDAVFSPDGRSVVLVSSGASVATLFGTDAPTARWSSAGAVSAAFSPDGARVALGRADGGAEVRAVEAGAAPVSVRAPGRTFARVVFSGDASHLLTLATDGVGQLWRAATQAEEICTFSMSDPGDLSSVQISPRGSLIAIPWDQGLGTVRLVSLKGERCRTRDLGGSGQVPLEVSVDFSGSGNPGAWTFDPGEDRALGEGRDGVWVLSVDQDPMLLLAYDSDWGRQPFKLFAEDGQSLLTLSDEGFGMLWPLVGSGTPKPTARALPGNVGLLQSVTPGGTLVQWLLRSEARGAQALRRELVLGDTILSWFSFSEVFLARSAWMTVTGVGELAGVWRPGMRANPVVIGEASGELRQATYSEDGQSILVIKAAYKPEASGSGPFHVDTTWYEVQALVSDADGRVMSNTSLSLPLPTPTIAVQTSPLRWIAFSRDGRLLRAMDTADQLLLATPGASKAVRVVPGAWGPVEEGAVSQDGARVVAFKDGQLSVFSTDSSGTVRPLGPCPEPSVTLLSPDGARVLTSHPDGTLRLWATDGSADPALLTGRPGSALAEARFTPDGSRISARDDSGATWVWRVEAPGDGPRQIQGSAQIAFSSDGRFAVTATTGNGDPGSVRLWDLDTRDPARLLWEGEARPWTGTPSVRALAFSPDGSRVLIELDDGSVRIVLTDGSRKQEIRSGSMPRTSAKLVFSPDGAHLLTAEDQGVVRVWPLLDAPQVLDALWRATPYCFPPDRRVILLKEAEGDAQDHYAACREHVAELRAKGAYAVEDADGS